jgi:FixJ family two-component response regulator
MIAMRGMESAIVLVVDDDDAVRLSLARVIRSAGWRVATFPTAQDFLAELPPTGPGCVVLDICLPGLTGPELHDRMCEQGIGFPVIFLTGKGDVRTGVQAMKRGAADFLEKPVDDAVLLLAIERAVTRHALSIANMEAREEIESRFERLSTREREVMEYVIGGLLNKQIAAELGIAEKTVKAHRHEMMEKLALDSIAELVRLCERAGIRPRRFRTAVRFNAISAEE